MFAKIKECLHRLRRDERGLTTVEYAIVLCLIAALAVAAWRGFGDMVKERLDYSNETISTELDISP